MRTIKRLAFVLTWIIALGAFAALPLLAQTNGKAKPSAEEVIKRALETARAENKNVLVHFDASWCGWCKRFDAFLRSPEAGKLMADNYVTVSLTVMERPDKKDMENPGAGELMREMGGAAAGIPFYFFLDKEGKKLANSMAMPDGGNIGHPANAQEIKAFAGLIERTAPHMTSEQRARIIDYLTKSAPRR
ncbi:MAG: thioredoxin family protein [Blastocatellia bacterium]|nr:thioredoxin family protein [Blastocatellia bacterium]